VTARTRTAVIVSLIAVAGCVDRLPDQDRRITAVTHPAFKLSVDLLWKEYQADRAGADRKYWGKAIDVSGKVTAVEKAPPSKLTFAQETPHGVDAFLLNDQSGEILSSVEAGQRVTLRCFCAGLVEQNVTLRSCVRP